MVTNMSESKSKLRLRKSKLENNGSKQVLKEMITVSTYFGTFLELEWSQWS